ncbi:helix-turn-helix protein [Streptomyces sp. TLI_55]|uniref:helix-turn-helix domain-containing protein n=1 Tax=Streptomyces sp. TLI_55 TaxID=1938861 RepID=UPI000BC60864|nr:helix-turn-helix transcriptional regulator [Streptomyces sp. TLI_55]SNX56236.1 helix-turn-helix protein [Streptomyces sp. TLI_55]
MSEQAPNQARVIPLRPIPARAAGDRPSAARPGITTPPAVRPVADRPAGSPPPKEPLWRDLVGDVLRRERLAQERTLKDVADAARISMPYLSEVERGRKEASSEVLAAAAQALGLGLGDLLARAQGELVRLTSRTSAATRRATSSSYDGLCLAA